MKKYKLTTEPFGKGLACRIPAVLTCSRDDQARMSYLGLSTGKTDVSVESTAGRKRGKDGGRIVESCHLHCSILYVR